MIDDFSCEISNNYLDKIRQVYSQQIDNSDKLKQITSDFFKFLRKITEKSNQAFPTSFSRISYLIEKYNLDADITLIKKISKTKYIPKNRITLSIVDDVYDEILDFLALFSNIENKNHTKKQISISEQNTNFNSERGNISEQQTLFAFQNIEKNNIDNQEEISLVCKNEYLEKITIKLHRKFHYLQSLPNYPTVIAFTGLKQVTEIKGTYLCDENCIVVVEPGYLVDITEIVHCFQQKKIDPYYYFENLLKYDETNLSLVLGSVVNSLFDLLIVNPAIDFETAFSVAIKQKPLNVVTSLVSETQKRLLTPQTRNIQPNSLKNVSEEFKMKAELHYSNLKNIITKLEGDFNFIEPTFISEKYGLQGRLDLLTISDKLNTKDVVELKSGKPPKGNIKYLIDNKLMFLNAWIGHTTQANGYNLILEDVFENRRGNSSILYSIDNENPIRNVTNDKNIKNEIIELRNKVLIIIKNIVSDKIHLNDILKRVATLPNFNDKENEFQKFISSNLNRQIIDFFDDLFKFIIREDYISKLKNNIIRSDSIYNDLRMNIESENFQIAEELEIDYDRSDLNNSYIYFQLKPEDFEEINFRISDQVIIYPSEYKSKPTNFFMLRGYIRTIDSNEILISLLSKSYDKNFFAKYEKWNIEIDNSDSLVKKQFKVLALLIKTDVNKQNILINPNKTKSSENEIPQYDYLNENQYKLVKNAINRESFYLIQGPPGTGKTSRIIRAITDYYYNNSKNILLLAYTNRAVDEICEMLEKIHQDFPFIRIGSKEIENFTEKTISYYSDILSIGQLHKKISETRVYVSTVSSIINNNDIFLLKEFDLIILDEASQVLDSQIIGILTKVEKFILVGDIKQLPAISLQNSLGDASKNQAISLFQRMQTQLIQNNSIEMFESLSDQGRMHQTIQDLSNLLAYENILRPISDNQINQKSPYLSLSPILDELFQNRVIFIDVPIDKKTKRNKFEISLVEKIINEFINFQSKLITYDSVGIISPFKQQCSEIRNKIPHDYSKKIIVDTVERFQGSERDIIIYSFALNYQFMMEKISSNFEFDGKIIDRKFNVAITRAKEHLILIGNQEILNTNPIYASTINWIEKNGKIYNFDEFNKIF